MHPALDPLCAGRQLPSIHRCKNMIMNIQRGWWSHYECTEPRIMAGTTCMGSKALENVSAQPLQPEPY